MFIPFDGLIHRLNEAVAHRLNGSVGPIFQKVLATPPLRCGLMGVSAPSF